jgi:hypothetical protein
MNLFFKKFALLLLSSSLFAQNSFIAEGTKLDASLDESNTIHPDIFLPINWSEYFTSSLLYRTNKSITQTQAQGETTLNSKMLDINLLNFRYQAQNSSYSLGAGLLQETFKKVQIGSSTYPIVGDITYNNHIDIDVIGFSVKAEFIHKELVKNLSLKTNFLLSPSSQLNVSQDTSLTSSTALSQGLSKANETLSPIYELNLNLLYKTSYYLSFGIEARYHYLPLNYNLAVVDSQLNPLNKAIRNQFIKKLAHFQQF